MCCVMETVKIIRVLTRYFTQNIEFKIKRKNYKKKNAASKNKLYTPSSAFCTINHT